jgi:hypothetical protein
LHKNQTKILDGLLKRQTWVATLPGDPFKKADTPTPKNGGIHQKKGYGSITEVDLGSTKNQLADEIQSKHNAHADPIAESGGRETTHGNPVPQEQENPTLKAEHTKGDTKSQNKAQGNQQTTDQTTTLFTNVNHIVFHKNQISFQNV